MPEAAKSRGFIDQVFAVFGEHGNYATCDGDSEGKSRPLMEGGREAWRMLWRLRKKAYKKAGIISVPETDKETDDPNPPTAAEQMSDPFGLAPYMPYPTTPPLPPQTADLAQPPPGGFEELLQMDTIIDAEDKAFFTEEVTANFMRTINTAFPLPPPTTTTTEGLFGENEAEHPLDMMDFDWEEWDQVFGKSVVVNDVSGG